MKISVIGTRGIPNIQGGVEQHCERLYVRMSSLCSITIYRRKPYIDASFTKSWNNIRLVDLPSTRSKGREALFHSFLGAVICIFKRPDIIHIHNIGPGLFTPLFRLLRLKVIMTYHSPNYEHEKWSFFAKKILKLGEILSLRFANHIIFVNNKQRSKFGKNIIKKSSWIPNGVFIPVKSTTHEYIDSLGLTPYKYILAVGRITQEKGFDYLIEAYRIFSNQDYKLVIVGGVDHDTAYAKNLRKIAQKNNVLLTGYVCGESLNQLYTYAKLFVLPSYNEGFPLALLEAMSYQLRIIVSEIPANLQVELPLESYFKCGDPEDLKNKMGEALTSEKEINYDLSMYNWDKIAKQTFKVYEKVFKKGKL